jgi:DNA uptake protein ComE-like DNA-binding protein
LQSCSRNQLEEILGIDKKTAHSLYKFLRYNQGGEIEDVDGIDDEILNKFKKYFHSLK